MGLQVVEACSEGDEAGDAGGGAALDECKGNRSHAARMLGMARSNLIVKIKTYGLG